MVLIVLDYESDIGFGTKYSFERILVVFPISNKSAIKRDPKHSMGPLIVIFRQILQSKHVSKLGTDAAFMYCRGLRHSETKIPS